MSSSLSHSPARGGRPRTLGVTASGGSSEGTGTLLRGAISGSIGASPFGVLATTPELPVSTVTCETTSTSSRSPPAPSRHGGLSLRRVNSSSNWQMGRTVSGGVVPGVAPASGGGRRGILLRRAGAALFVLQFALICALLFRPSLVHDVSGVVKSASVAFFGFYDSSGRVDKAELFDETSTEAIVAKLAADSRRSARAGGAPASRRERMWPTAGELDARQGQGQRQPQQQFGKVRVVTTANSAGVKAAKTVEVKTTTRVADVKAKPVAISDAQAVVATLTAKAGVPTVKVAASGAAATGAAMPAHKTASFPPFLKPVLPFPGRAADAPPIVGVIFYGRRDRVRILDCYLQRNLIRNGGLLAYVVFVTATWQPDDVEFLDRLIAYRAGDYRKLYPQRVDKGYTGHYLWMDPDTMYVKIDDDVIFFADEAIDHMLLAHNLHRYHLISANVVNHQPLELPHSQAGAHLTFEQTRPGDKTSWKPVMRPHAAPAKANDGTGGAGGVALEPVPYMDNGWDVWGDWRRAANVHYSFLANHAAGRLRVYDFPANEQLWDFNRHFGYTRWRINMIMFKGSTIDVRVYNMSSTVGTYPGDDEDYITRILPKQLNRTSAAVSQALAVHFSFFMQRPGLENHTDLLDRYTLLAERTCGRLVSASP